MSVIESCKDVSTRLLRPEDVDCVKFPLREKKATVNPGLKKDSQIKCKIMTRVAEHAGANLPTQK
jgi:hypothetical protein